MKTLIDLIKKGIKEPRKIINYLASKGAFDFLSDKDYISLVYYARLKKRLDLSNPKTFNEKLQWLKLYDRNSSYTDLVDKYEVRKHIEKTIGKEYLIPLIGVWDKFEDINFDSLPEQFVLKCTHDSGGLIICKDKNKLDIEAARIKINKCLKRNYYYHTREWPYKNIKPRIICEKYMVDESGLELKDYKFMCFNGEPKIIQVMSGRKDGRYFINHFDLDWKKIDIPRKTHKGNPKVPSKPKSLSKMIKISKILSKNKPFVRVDLYEIENMVYFGEITFFPVSGYMDFRDEQDDYLLGSWIDLNTNNTEENCTCI